MQEKIEKAKLHRVISTGTMEHRFEVLCKDRSGRGIRRDRVVQESLITVDGKAFFLFPTWYKTLYQYTH